MVTYTESSLLKALPCAWSIRFQLCRAISSLALPLGDCLEPLHSHERHTVHGLHEHKSHEQDVPCGDGNKDFRLCSSWQSFQPIDKPARYRQNLYRVDTKEVRDPEIAPHGAPVDHRQPGTLRRNAHHTLSLRHHHRSDGGSCKEKEKPECDPELR